MVAVAQLLKRISTILYQIGLFSYSSKVENCLTGSVTNNFLRNIECHESVISYKEKQKVRPTGGNQAVHF